MLLGGCGQRRIIASVAAQPGPLLFWRASTPPLKSRVLRSHNSTDPLQVITTTSRPLCLHGHSHTLSAGAFKARKRPLLHGLSTTTARRMDSTASYEASDWSAQKVRDTFLQFFEDRGHTFGMFRTFYELPNVC